MPATTASGQTAFRDAVKHERRIELAFENHRYWDLVRWGDAVTIQNQPVTGVEITQNNLGDFIYTHLKLYKTVYSSLPK